MDDAGLTPKLYTDTARDQAKAMRCKIKINIALRKLMKIAILTPKLYTDTARGQNLQYSQFNQAKRRMRL